MLDVRKPRLRPYALEGNFGLERESLRVTAEGHIRFRPTTRASSAISARTRRRSTPVSIQRRKRQLRN